MLPLLLLSKRRRNVSTRKSPFLWGRIFLKLLCAFVIAHFGKKRLEQELDKIIELQPLKNRDINSIKILSVIIYLILEEKIDFSNITEQISQELALENAQEIKEIQLIEKLINHL